MTVSVKQRGRKYLWHMHYLQFYRVRTALAQCHAFAVTGPSSWNDLPHLHFPSGVSALKAPPTS